MVLDFLDVGYRSGGPVCFTLSDGSVLEGYMFIQIGFPLSD